MLKKWNSRLLVISAAIALSACASQQAAAPINDATAQINSAYNQATSAINTATTDVTNAVNHAANVYGAPAYNPNAAVPTYSQPTYTPPVNTASTGQYGRVGNQYIPNYSAVDATAATHIVSPGDTVYNIAKRYGISQDTLRSLNGLTGNTISLGQVLRVKSGSGNTVGNATPATVPTNQVVANTPAVTAPVVTPPVVSTPVVSTPPPVVATSPVNTTTPSNTTNANTAPNKTTTVSDSFLPTQNVANITWHTPTKGKVIAKFGGSNKGIDITGTRGQDVYAAADGQVVYSGSNLRGYGNLVIIQHTPAYLSAYGHNDSLVVREGDSVKGGQVIAKMGQTDSSNGVKLHFEVRENGTPVDPSRFVKF